MSSKLLKGSEADQVTRIQSSDKQSDKVVISNLKSNGGGLKNVKSEMQQTYSTVNKHSASDY